MRKRNGLFCPYYPLKDEHGRPLRDSTGKVVVEMPTPRSFPTRAAADGWLRSTRQKHESRRTAIGYTIHDAATDFLQAKRSGNSPNTIKTDEKALASIEDAAKRTAIADCSPKSMTNWFDPLGLTTHQHKRAYVFLSSMFTWLESVEMIDRNPMRALRAPRHEPAKPDPFTKEEARAILKAAIGHEYESFFAVQLTLGLRPGEAFGLSWDSVDLIAGTIHVHRALEEIDGKLRLKETPKTTKSNRTLVLPELAREALQKHAAKGNRQGPVWKAPRGGYLYNGTFRSRVFLPLVTGKADKGGAGLRERPLYALRHTAITLMLLEGVPLRVVSEIAGHSSPATTMKIYAHIFDGTQRVFAPRIDAILRVEPENKAQNNGNGDSSGTTQDVA